MKKARLCICGFLAVSCLSATLDSDVSLPHDFDFSDQLPKDDSVVSGTVGDCYAPDLNKTLHKIDGNSSSSPLLHWNVSDLNDVAVVSGGDASKIIGFSFYIMDDSSAKLNIPASDIKILPNGTIHLVPNIDTNQIIKFLSGGNVQVCLFLSGELSKNFPKIIHNNFSFHVEVEISKSL
jgi:hypothetical protein